MTEEVNGNTNTIDESLLLVSGSKGSKEKDKEYVKKLANAIFQTFSKHSIARLRCVGAASLNNAIKSFIIAKVEFQKNGDNLFSTLKDSFSLEHSQPQAKVTIKKSRDTLKALFIEIRNLIPNEEGRIKKDIQAYIQQFIKTEKALLDSLTKADQMHDEIEQLKSISKELKNLKTLLTSKDKDFDLKKIQEILDNLKALKIDSQFDTIIDEYRFVSDQFDKIKTHESYISNLQKVLSNPFFKNSLLQKFAKAQKELKIAPKSGSKEKKLMLHKELSKLLKSLKPIAKDTDISELKKALKKISDSSDIKEIDEAYDAAKKLFEKILAKHKSLLIEENTNLTTKCFEQCKSTIQKHENTILKIIQDLGQNLIKKVGLFLKTLEMLEKEVNAIDNPPALEDGQTTTATKKTRFSFIPQVFSALTDYFANFNKRHADSNHIIAKKYIPALVTDGIALPFIKPYTESANRIITTPTFYEGLIHISMKAFIDSVNPTSASDTKKPAEKK